MDARSFAVLSAGALVVPLALWLAWLAQMWTVDALHRRTTFSLSTRHAKLREGVLFASTFLHEGAHAIVSVLGGHGIQEFRVGDDGGHVHSSPRPLGPVRAVTAVLTSLAPLFMPPLVVVALVIAYFDRGLVAAPLDGPLGWDAARPLLDSTIDTGTRFVQAFVEPRLAHPAWWAIVAMGLGAMPAARPSADIRHGGAVFGDLNNVRATIRGRPFTFLAAGISILGAYGLTLTGWSTHYWFAIHLAWTIALAGVLLALGSGLVWAVLSRALPRRPAGLLVSTVIGLAVYAFAPTYAPALAQGLGHGLTAGAFLGVGLAVRMAGG